MPNQTPLLHYIVWSNCARREKIDFSIYTQKKLNQYVHKNHMEFVDFPNKNIHLIFYSDRAQRGSNKTLVEHRWPNNTLQVAWRRLKTVTSQKSNSNWWWWKWQDLQFLPTPPVTLASGTFLWISSFRALKRDPYPHSALKRINVTKLKT